MEALITPVNVLIAALTLGLGTTKALAVRQQREWTLRLTASVLVVAGTLFLLATPEVYRTVGAAVGSPNVCALLVPAATLLCVGHAHALSQLWREDRREPAVLRRTAARWGPVYGGALTAMTALYFHAPLGPAAPLRFASAYAHVPEVVAFHLVYWVALITTVVVTVRECMQLSIPAPRGARGDLRRCIAWFALALSMDLVNVGLTASALVGSAVGPRRLDGMAESAWLATVASCVAANVALASLVLRSRRAERHDLRTLQALHHLVVERDPAVERDPHIVLAPRWSAWAGFDTRLTLNSLLAEIHDGCGRLSPWWSTVPAAAALRLAEMGRSPLESCTEAEDRLDDEGQPHTWDVLAAQDAATLLYAAQARSSGHPGFPRQSRLARLPGADVEPHQDRQHLVRVAQHLSHPLVLQAVEITRQVQAVASARDN